MGRFDVIVVGAGPAGSTAARECAACGLKTLLLERAEFPRDKPCGGGVTVRAARLLPFGIDPVTERVATGMAITVRGRHALRRSVAGPLVYLTQRRRLDAFLAERAVAAGVEFCERREVRSVERNDHSVVVRAGTLACEGRVLIVADGVNGKTARLAGINVKRRLTVAIEGNITPSGIFPERWEDVLGIDAGEPLGGYGWIFPKGDHLNVGVASLPRLGPELRGRLHTLTRRYGFDPAGLWGVRGYHLPTRRHGSPLVDGNVLLAGDAAGLLDPFSLEGIYAAIWSGQRAAHHAAHYLTGEAANLSGYAHDVETVLQPDLDMARQIYDLSWLVGWRVWLAAARYLSGSPDVMWRLIRGDQTYSGIRRRLGRFAVGLDITSMMVQRLRWVRRRAYDDPG